MIEPDSVAAWPAPTPLRSVAQLPTFPVEVFPEWLAQMVAATAADVQVPEDLPAMLALGVISAAATGSVEVGIRRDWTEPVHLYLAVAMPPGSAKSPVFRRMTAPVKKVAGELREEVAPLIKAAMARKRIFEEAAERAERAAARDTTPEAVERAVSARIAADEVTVPIDPRLLVDDATPEELTSLLKKHGGRLAVLSDEAAIFTQMAGQYGDKANLDVYLKAHDGGELQVNRRERDEAITRATMTIGVAVQPAVLEQLGGNAQLRGRGLTARFLYCLPPSLVGWREIETPLVPGEVRARYDEQVAAIAGALLPDPGKQPMLLRVDAEALAVLNDFRRQIEPRLRPDEDLANLGGWIAKLAGHTARIAALLHLVHLPPEQWSTEGIGSSTMRGAVQLAWYFIHHALAAFDVMGADDTLRTAQRVLAWAERKGRPQFSHRDAFDALRNSDLRKTTDLDAPLALLVNFGWLSPLPAPPPGPQGGRRPSPSYAVHPSVVTGPASR